MNNKYFLDQDESSHWYLVPLQYKEEWYNWCDEGYDWDCEFYNKVMTEGWMIESPKHIIFENPKDIRDAK